MELQVLKCLYKMKTSLRVHELVEYVRNNYPIHCRVSGSKFTKQRALQILTDVGFPALHHVKRLKRDIFASEDKEAFAILQRMLAKYHIYDLTVKDKHTQYEMLVHAIMEQTIHSRQYHPPHEQFCHRDTQYTPRLFNVSGDSICQMYTSAILSRVHFNLPLILLTRKSNDKNLVNCTNCVDILGYKAAIDDEFMYLYLAAYIPPTSTKELPHWQVFGPKQNDKPMTTAYIYPIQIIKGRVNESKVLNWSKLSADVEIPSIHPSKSVLEIDQTGRNKQSQWTPDYGEYTHVNVKDEFIKYTVDKPSLCLVKIRYKDTKTAESIYEEQFINQLDFDTDNANFKKKTQKDKSISMKVSKWFGTAKLYKQIQLGDWN